MESSRVSLEEDITSEMKEVILDSPKKFLKLLKPKTGGSEIDENELLQENESGNVCSPPKTVRINNPKT